MSKNKEINIKEFTVTGIVNTIIRIKGYGKERTNLELLVDSKKVNLIPEIILDRSHILELMNPNNESNKMFDFYANIPNTSKKIELYLLKNNENKLLLEVKYTSFLKRILIRTKSVISKLKNIPTLINKIFKVIWKQYHLLIPLNVWKRYIISLRNNFSSKTVEEKFYNPSNQKEYIKWLSQKNEITKYSELKKNPNISILLTDINKSILDLSNSISSVINQTYKNLQLCIVIDKNEKELLKKINSYGDKRIVVKTINKNKISIYKELLSLSTGKYVGFLNSGDLLDKDALYETVKILNDNQNIDFIYTDEDQIDKQNNRLNPYFKPNYSPDTLLSQNYIGHFSLIKKELIIKVGGFKKNDNHFQEYDMFLKIVEKTSNIYHLPMILYHAKSKERTFNDNFLKTGKKILEDALKRRKIDAVIKIKQDFYEIQYKLKKEPKISIIIPTRDYADILETCLKSIYDKTNYNNYEIIVVDNGSIEEKTKNLFKKYLIEKKNFRVVRIDTEFNYSYLNNEAVKKAKGDYVLLLNNDTEVISSDWLKIMVGYASQKHIGCVGAKLLYPDNTLQHCGVILGLGGIASHFNIGALPTESGYHNKLLSVSNCSAVTGACLMISKKKYLEVGGLDENLKVAYNDIDLNIKIMESGYYNVVLPQVFLYHHESKSRGYDLSDSKIKRYVSEIKYMIKKWENKTMHDNYYNDNFSYNWWFFLEKKEKDDEKE